MPGFDPQPNVAEGRAFIDNGAAASTISSLGDSKSQVLSQVYSHAAFDMFA